MRKNAASGSGIFRRTAWLMAASAAAMPAIAGAAAADQFVYYFNAATSTGGSSPPSLGGYAYNPTSNTFYTLAFSGTGQSIRAITNSSSTWTGTTLVGQTDWLNLLKTDNIATADVPSTLSATNPTVGGMLLNPTSLTVGGITYPAGSLGIVIEAAKTSNVGPPSSVNSTYSKLVYAYDLRAVTYDGGGNYNGVAAPGTRDWNSDGIIEWNDVFYPIVSFADEQTLNPGQTSTSNNVARRFAFSSNGQSIYFDDASTAYGGIYKVNLTATGGSAISKIVSSKGSTTINTEPGVVATTTRDFGAGFGAGDQVLFAGSTDTGNIGGISYVVDNGTTVSAPHTLLTAKQIAWFLDYPGASATVFSITSDSSGDVYIENSNSTYGGVFEYDTSGRFSKVFNSAEQRTFDFANSASYNSSVLETEIVPTTVTYASGPTVINQLVYREVGLRAPVGVNVYKPGDFNHDGVIDSTDIANFKAHLGLRGAISGYIAGGSTTVNGDYFTYDLNGAFATTVGSTSVEAVSVDWKDAEIFCQYAGLSYGDVNMDGSVNYADLNTLASNYGLTNKIWTDGKLSSVRINAPDANTVGLVDLVTEAANWPVASLGKPALSYNASGAPDLIPSATLDRAFAITSGGTISQIANTSSGTVNWGTASTWINGDNASIVPNSPGAIASLLNKATNDTTVNIDGNYTVGQLNFDNYFTFTLSGAGTLHLAGNNGTSAEVNTFAQSPVISAAVSLDSPTNITITYSTDTATFSGAISGMGSLNKLGAGAVLLTGANSYSGGTNVSTGTLQATTPASLPGYAAAGNVSVGGAGTLILNVGGITEWTRTGVDSLQAAATFAAGSYLGFDTTNAAGTATLASNLTGSIGILKQGPNTLQLTGTNSYSGLTNVSGGVLLASTPTALPGYTTTNSITVASGATAAVNVGGAGEWTSSQIDTLRGNLGLSSGSGIGIDTTDAPSGFTYGSVITGTGVGFSKMGPNTLTLTGNSTYNGSTSVLGGTLSLNFAGASSPLNILAPTSSLILANNGGLSVIGNASATNSQTLGGLTLNAGSAAIIAAASTTNPLLLSVGSITRNIGATVDFTDPAGTQSATNGIITTSSTSSSVLGGWATIGQSDWAGKSSSGDIIPLASYTNDTWSGSNNTTVTASSAPSINSSTNTLRFAATGSYTLILSGVNNIGTGGVLVAPAVGANNDTITGGTITGKTSTDLIVNQFDTSGSLEIDSVIADASSATGLTKSGGGLLILTGGNTYTGSTFVNAGTVNVSSGSLASTSYTIQAGAKLNVIALNALPINSTLSDNGSVTFGPNTASAGPASLTLSSLLIGPGGIVNLADPAVHSNRTVLSLSALAVAGGVNAWTGTLNIGGNDLILHNSSLATVTNLVASGFYGTSPWTGKGLTSSTAAADTSHLTAVGVILNNDGSGNALYGSSTTLGNFDRLSPSTSDVLVKYTYYGDANLDGKVDSSDYARIDGGFLSSGSLTGWFNGDSNYDGLVNGSDYTLIDNAFNTQSAALTNQIANPTAQFATTGAAAAVPEPATFGLFGLTVLGSLGLRRRKTTSVAI